jgi:hypothetical protein
MMILTLGSILLHDRRIPFEPDDYVFVVPFDAPYVGNVQTEAVHWSTGPAGEWYASSSGYTP